MSSRDLLALQSLALAAFVTISGGFAMAEETRPPGAIDEEVNPKVIPGLVRPNPTPSGRKGPLAPLADRLADEGLTFHAISIDFLQANPTSGLQPGHVDNSLYNILGVDFDLARHGLQGSSLHYETTIFSPSSDLGFISAVGDSQLGYQGTYNTKLATISVATFEQKLLGDRLDFEIGRTHPNRYYGLPLCQSLNTCLEDILYFNGGFTSPLYSVWGTNVSYKLSPTLYVESGVFTTNNNTRIGYDLGAERTNGIVGVAEIGRKTDFDSDPYPSRISLTGFFNTAKHQNLNAQSASNPGATIIQEGTSGFLLQEQKIVWRADGGLEHVSSPTSIALYGSVAAGLDSTQPLLADLQIGATLQSPFESRPADRFSIKARWERLNQNYTDYLAAANFAAGGTGAPFNPNKFVFETSAHLQLPAGLAFEPVFQYAVNLNSYYNPATAARPRNGIYVCGVLIVPIASLLGLTPS